MTPVRAVLSVGLKYTFFLFLCFISGTALELNAQEASYKVSADDAITAPPIAQSSELDSQSTQPQSISQPQPTPTKSLNPNYRPMKVRERWYFDDLIGPAAFLVTGVQAGIDQGRTLKTPYPPDGFVGHGNHRAHGAVPEWGEGFDGFAKRYASRFGQHLTGATIKYGLGEALREDVTYHRCDCTGICCLEINQILRAES